MSTQTKFEKLQQGAYNIKASLRQVAVFKDRVKRAEVALGKKALPRVAEPLVAVVVAAASAAAHVMGIAAEVAEAAVGIREEQGLSPEEAIEALGEVATAIAEGFDEVPPSSLEEEAKEEELKVDIAHPNC